MNGGIFSVKEKGFNLLNTERLLSYIDLDQQYKFFREGFIWLGIKMSIF
jgi:hypothetical protein